MISVLWKEKYSKVGNINHCKRVCFMSTCRVLKEKKQNEVSSILLKYIHVSIINWKLTHDLISSFGLYIIDMFSFFICWSGIQLRGTITVEQNLNNVFIKYQGNKICRSLYIAKKPCCFLEIKCCNITSNDCKQVFWGF